MKLSPEACLSATPPPDLDAFVCPAPTGDWKKDNLAGRRAALDLAQRVRATGDVPLVNCAMGRIYGCPHSDICGVRAGFSCVITKMMEQFRPQ